jgi:hypothetical protein
LWNRSMNLHSFTLSSFSILKSNKLLSQTWFLRSCATGKVRYLKTPIDAPFSQHGTSPIHKCELCTQASSVLRLMSLICKYLLYSYLQGARKVKF